MPIPPSSYGSKLKKTRDNDVISGKLLKNKEYKNSIDS